MDLENPRHSELTEQFDFDTASEFLNWLDVSNSRWSSGFTTHWIFRGQRDVSWGLVPSAWRGTDKSLGKKREEFKALNSSLMYRFVKTYDLGNAHRQDDTADCLAQAAAEIDLVYLFCRLANDIGLHVPEPQEFHGCDFLYGVHNQRPKVPYHPPFFPQITAAFALAQHHGVPTRLLDFSFRPEVAAFFAADDVVAHSDLDGRLCVWAVNVARCVVGTDRKLQTMTVPRSTHSFLHAQDGLFLWAPEGDSDFFYLRSMNGARLDSVANWRGWPPGGPVFRKITVPKREAPEILRMLYLKRISRCHLMPSYSGVSESLHRIVELE